MSRNLIHAALVCSLLFGCSESKTWNQGDIADIRDSIIEFNTGDAMIGWSPRIAFSDSMMFVLDETSTDKVVKVFSLPQGEFLSEFGNYGPGPYEIGGPNSLNVYEDDLDGRTKALIVDLTQNCILVFDVDSVMHDEEYIPQRIHDLHHGVIPAQYVRINNTQGFACKIQLGSTGAISSKSLGMFNLSTGELTDFAPEHSVANNNSVFSVSTKYGLVAEASTNVDEIKIYDFNGDLLYNVKGSEYTNDAQRRRSFFSNVTFADDLILGVYSGGTIKNDYLGEKIAVLDKEGNYITTLNVGRKIRDLKYHEPTGRLYMSFYNDDWQFGWLDLHSVL